MNHTTRTCGHVETETFVSPSSYKVTAFLAKSKPNAEGIARLHSYQKPVETAMYELLPSSSIALRAGAADGGQRQQYDLR